jgi:hypothetical protein
MQVDNEMGVVRDDYGFINIKFQLGNAMKVGQNGTTIQELMELLLSRLNKFQATEMHDEYTNHVIFELKKVLDILDRRITERMERGVYGERIP